MNESPVIEKEESALYEKRSQRAIENFARGGINAQYAATRDEALLQVMAMIPAGVTVGTADSMTLHQVGVISAIEARGQNALINPFARDAQGNRLFQGEEREDLKRKVLTCDVYVIGTNAVTLDGKLVNTDAGGNRVAAMIFGPKKVIVVAGANKLVKDADAAFRRIRELAAPQNALRIGIKHHSSEHLELPCTKTGLCADCHHPKRICRYTTIIEGVSSEHRGRINVVLVGERLGI
ncbi:MAG: lactate utilization protein [Deltaproteobacteria bacterium]|nr:lactate utilization protein [Deltaproteobacteria bacterium]